MTDLDASYDGWTGVPRSLFHLATWQRAICQAGRCDTLATRRLGRTGLQEISDREFEHQRVLVGLSVERDTPLEAQRADRREPAEAEADRLAQAVGQRVERAEAR